MWPDIKHIYNPINVKSRFKQFIAGNHGRKKIALNKLNRNITEVIINVGNVIQLS